MPDRAIPTETDYRIRVGDRLGLSEELRDNSAYAAFCWHVPILIPHGEMRALWDAMSHLDETEVKELLTTYLVGKEQERLGVIGMLTAGVPVRFMTESSVDPRLESAEEQFWGWRDVVVLWEAGVPHEALDQLVQLNMQRKAVVPAEGIATMARAQVPVSYMVEMLAQGVEPDAVARAWNEGLPAEYGTAAFRD